MDSNSVGSPVSPSGNFLQFSDESDCLIDLLADERNFYSSTSLTTSYLPRIGFEDFINDDTSRSSSRCRSSDSGFVSSRWNKPVPSFGQNQPKGHAVERLRKSDVKRTGLQQVCLLEMRGTHNDMYKIDFQRIVWHLIEFLRFPTDRLLGDFSNCFFSRKEDEILVNDKFFCTHGDLIRLVKEMLPSFARMYVIIRNKLQDLFDFSARIDSIPTKPLFTQRWLSFFLTFMMEYDTELTTLQQNLKHPAMLPFMFKPLNEKIDVLHWIVEPVKTVIDWDYRDLELLFERMLAVLAECTISENQAQFAAQFQRYMIEDFLQTMDSIYSVGQVPFNTENHFVLFNDPREHEMLVVRLGSECSSEIWSEEIFEVILCGVQLLWRLNVDRSFRPLFSQLLLEKLELTDNKPLTRPFTLHAFRRALLSACHILTNEYGSKMCEKLKINGAVQLWRDMRNLCIGDAARLFNNQIITAVYRPCVVDESAILFIGDNIFNRVLDLCNISNVRKWKRSSNADQSSIFVHCKVGEILALIYPNSLFEVWNEIRNLFSKLLRMQIVLNGVVSMRNPLLHTTLKVQRIYQFVVYKLASVVELVLATFIEYVERIFESVEKQLESATTFDECKNSIQFAEQSFIDLVNQNDGLRSKECSEFIGSCERLADIVKATSLCQFVDDMKIIQLRLDTLRILELVALLGKYQPLGTIFHNVHMRLNFI